MFEQLAQTTEKIVKSEMGSGPARRSKRPSKRTTHSWLDSKRSRTKS